MEAILAQNGVTLGGPPSDLGSAMSWRLTGWMEEYADGDAPNASVSVLNEDTQPDLSSSVESIIAHAPLLPAHAPTSDSAISSSHYSSEGSSAITVRPEAPVAQSACEDHRPHHQREPNIVPTSQSSFDENVSYFTASAPSQLPSQSDQMDVDSIAPIPISHDNPTLIPDTIGNDPVASPSPASVILTFTPETPQLKGVSSRLHRFSLVKSGKRTEGISSLGASSNAVVAGHEHSVWSPLDLFFGNGWGMCGKCDLCAKRLGWKPVLECDDCGLRCVQQSLTVVNSTNRFRRVHMRCGENAPMDCQERETTTRTRAIQPAPKLPKAPRAPKSNASSPKKRGTKNK